MIISLGLGQNVDSLYKQGSSYLKSGQYENAVSMFEMILNQGIFHEDLYYNLGNSYYRLGSYGSSIWAYEKAIKLYPLDVDAKFNLSLANAHVKDRILIPETHFFIKWYRFFKSSLTFSQFMSISALFILLASIYYLVINVFQINFSWLPLQIFLFLGFILHGILLDKYWDISEQNEGIII
ncbi:uncharacterized protein METZ01_LOCUS279079, partial [marine metagenome]